MKMKSLKYSNKIQLGLMLAITVLTQLLLVYKSAVLAKNFGANIELDAYNFANNISTFFLTFVSAGVTTVIIPAYIQKKEKEAVDTFLTVVFGVTLMLLIFTYIFRIPIVGMLTDRTVDFEAYVQNILFLTMLIQGIPAFLGVTAAFYQCEGKYNIPKVILFISNFLVILFLITSPQFTIYEYLMMLLISAIFQFIVDIGVALFYGFRFRISFRIKNAEFKKLLKIFSPTVVSTGAFKIQTMIDVFIASNLGDGKLTILAYAGTIINMVNSLLIGNLTVYAYPKIVFCMQESEEKGQILLWKYAVFFHAAICLVIAGFFACGREFIGVLFENGKFTKEAANLLFTCTCIYICGQQNNIVRDLLYRYFYAHGDTKTTLKNSIVISILNIVLSIIAVRYIGLYGVIIGTVLAGAISLVLIIMKFKTKFGLLQSFYDSFKEFIKTTVVTIIDIVLISIFKNTFTLAEDIGGLIIYGSMSVMIFVCLLFVFRSRVTCLLRKSA